MKKKTIPSLSNMVVKYMIKQDKIGQKNPVRYILVQNRAWTGATNI